MTNKLSEAGKAAVLIDSQFGSTGKGLYAAYLAARNDFDIASTNASANAGHTTVIGDRSFITFHVPTTAVINTECTAFLNSGAIIDPEVLMREIEEFGLAGRLKIHPHAAVILPEHREAEKQAESSATKIGSTQKGVGAALCDKISRRGNVAKNHELLQQFVDPTFHLGHELDNGARAIVEVPQGFSLGVNSGFYPYTTSREVSVSSALSDAGLHPSQLGKTAMTARTFPIRVGNISDAFGREIGTSGPGYPDQRELSWAEDFPQFQPEVTTVTKRVRRIFEWSDLQWVHAIHTLRPDMVFCNFVNYLNNEDELEALIQRAGALYTCPGSETYSEDGEVINSEVPFTHFGIGPDVADVFERAWSATDAMKQRGLWA